MKAHTLCRCCGDKTASMAMRHDDHHGAVCPFCYEAMNGLHAMAILEGAIIPKPLPAGLDKWRLPSHFILK